jgi:hypothetical protein
MIVSAIVAAKMEGSLVQANWIVVYQLLQVLCCFD